MTLTLELLQAQRRDGCMVAAVYDKETNSWVVMSEPVKK